MRREIKTAPRQAPESSNRLRAVYRVAVVLALALAGALVAGSLYALARPADSAPLFQLGRQSDHAAGSGSAGWSDGRDINVFTGLGRLRIPLAGQPPATVVLSLSFPYPADDVFFAEELATRIGELRSIAVDYFSSLSRAEVARLNEARTKSEILARYNDMLRLGRIEELFFTDLIILE